MAAAAATNSSARRSPRNTRARGLIAGLGLMLAAGAVAPARADDAAARGAYIAAAAGCDGCHTDGNNNGMAYAGGRVMVSAFGAIATPNITPDKATGIGAWSEDDFVRAMRWGIAPDGTHYVPAFPFPYFSGLSDADLADLKAYLDTLTPVSRRGIPGATSLALLARARAALAVALVGKDVAPPPPATPQQARGAYLVAKVGHCGDCHTPAGLLGVPDLSSYLSGARGGVWGGGPNVTAGGKGGIGDWSEDDIASLLKDGAKPDGDFVSGAMGEIVHNTARLTDDDRRAIAAYLKTLSPTSLAKNN